MMEATTPRLHDQASTTTVAIALAAALIVTGGVAFAISDSGAPTTPTSSDQAAEDRGCTAEVSAETTATGTSTEREARDCQDQTSQQTHSFRWEGRTGTGACVATLPGECEGVHVPNRHARLDTGLTGTIAWANLTLGWTPTTPATQTLTIELVSVESGCEGSTCSHSYSLYAKATGTPPLTVNATDLDLDEGESLTIIVETVDTGPSSVDVDIDERFELTGHLRPATSASHQAA